MPATCRDTGVRGVVRLAVGTHNRYGDSHPSEAERPYPPWLGMHDHRRRHNALSAQPPGANLSGYKIYPAP
jgi:hypothetical protein